MANLQEKSFLELALDDGEIRFGSDLTQVLPAFRTLDEARYAFLEPEACGPAVLYLMYRNVARIADLGLIAALGLRFDVTVIMPGLIGQEYNKTVGHYHPLKHGTPYTYPEVYEVLHGEATYLLQRPGPGLGVVDDVIAVNAQAGQKVVIPPGFGHITINAGSVPLVMANWVAADFASIYGDFKEQKGGASYLVLRDGLPTWVPNKRYVNAPVPRLMSPIDYPAFGLSQDEPMYQLLINHPERLRFLTHPELFQWS